MKKILLSIFVILSLIAKTRAQSFYDLNTIQEIKIYFGFSNWDYRMDTSIAGSESYTNADSIVINGTNLPNCGVRFKGNSSYNANNEKNPLHIKLDNIINQNYQGYEDIKLSNGYSDPSMIREVLSYQILRQYMDAPLSNYTKVYINGTYIGIYSNDENIGNEFLDAHYYSSAGTLVKCNPENAGPTSGTGSSLLYVSNDSADYDTNYDMKSDFGWKNLINLCDTLNNNTASINNMLDIDRCFWMLAFNDVLVNLDSYSGSFRQNYYLYRNHKAQWIPTIWDLNMSFGSFTMVGSNTGGMGGGLSLATMQTLTPTLHFADSNWPLINKLLNTSIYKHMYIAHMRTINNENFVNSNYQNTANALQSIVDNAVSTDNNFFYTYAQFQAALTSSTASGGPMGNIPGIYELMDTRATYLNSTTEFLQIPPTITNVLANPLTPVFGSTVTFNATVTNTTTVYLGYRNIKSDRFSRIQMFDDGAHNDGASNDNVFGISIPVSSLEIQYYIYADNANAGMFSPERAEHEFYEIHPSITLATQNDIALNEYSADNQNGIENEDGKHRDWIEVYNKTSNALGLANIYLSDDLNDLQKWKFPDIAFIPANGHLLVWADDKDSTLIDYHTNFNLNSVIDSVFMVNDLFAIADSSTFSSFVTDASFARCPDGTGLFQFTSSLTPRATNICTGVSVDAINNQPVISVYPNPASDKLNYSLQNNFDLNKIEINNLIGQLVYQKNPDTNPSIDISNLSLGIYFVSFIDLGGARQIFKIIKE